MFVYIVGCFYLSGLFAEYCNLFVYNSAGLFLTFCVQAGVFKRNKRCAMANR